MVCGTGVGASIAANKVKGIRAAVCHDVHSAHQSVEHDDVNVMCIGAQIVGAWLAKDLVAAYLSAEFSTDEDFRRRVRSSPRWMRGAKRRSTSGRRSRSHSFCRQQPADFVVPRRQMIEMPLNHQLLM